MTLYYFDQNYVWGSIDGEPTYTENGVLKPASMRYLWSQFIDSYLATIETTAGSLILAAKTEWETYHPYAQLNYATQKAWVDSAFGTGGWATQAKMKFPRVAGVGTYGAYGNPAMSIDANGDTHNLGAPTPSSQDEDAMDLS